MNGETNLETLLATMQPVLATRPYIFAAVSQTMYDRLPFTPLGTFRETEGITIIATEEQAHESGLAFDGRWACITLTVHSALTAVGFLAAITGQLAQAGIPVNAISAFYHDHLFVPWEQRHKTVVILDNLSQRQL